MQSRIPLRGEFLPDLRIFGPGSTAIFRGKEIALGNDNSLIEMRFMSEISDTIRKAAWFSGRVQGVGFRFTSSRIAREFEISGFVKNLPDGRVHLVAEGRPEEVDGFIEEVRNQMESFIRKVERDDSEGPEGLHGFSIAR